MTDASSLMGPLLLKGWAMSADSCDDCEVPLMKWKKLNASVCCACETQLAKYIVNGCHIVADGPANFLIENDVKTI